MMKRLIGFAVLLSVLVLNGNGWAAMVQWSTGEGANGHWYEAVAVGDTGISWTNAKAAAEGSGGYLATIASAQENLFVFSLIQLQKFWVSDGYNSEGPWLGGYHLGPAGSVDANNWNWVTGDAWSYSNWAQGEPNSHDGIEEFYLNFFSFAGGGIIWSPTWNNMPDVWPLGSASNDEVLGYIVEYNSVPVPIPSAVLLLGSGLIGLVAVGRRRLRN